MRFRIGALLMVTIGSVAVAQSSAGPVAIECDGTWYKGEPFKDSKPVGPATRLYILDESNNSVSYWNELREKALPLCDQEFEKCEIVFEPTRVLISAKLNEFLSHEFELNRRTGSLHFYVVGKERGDTDSYWGKCRPTQMPRAQVELNQF